MNTIEKIYAQSITEAATNGNIPFEQILNEFNLIQETINNSNDLKFILQDKSIPLEQKLKIFDDLFAKRVCREVLNTTKILLENGRILDIKKIIKSFNELANEINGIKQAEITTAIELKPNYKEDIIKKLKARTGKDINPKWIINEEIIGGIVVKIGDEVIDTSVKNRLERLMKGNL